MNALLDNEDSCRERQYGLASDRCGTDFGNRVFSMLKTLLCMMILMSMLDLAALGQTLQTDSKAISTEIITSATLESVQKRIQAMGFDCTRGKDDSGKDETYLVFRAEGFKVGTFVPTPKTIELDTIFDDVHPTLETINEWNRDNRFSRAYLGQDGNVVLENDLDLSAGVTREEFELFIGAFRDSVARWARFVVAQDDKKQSAPSAQ